MKIQKYLVLLALIGGVSLHTPMYAAQNKSKVKKKVAKKPAAKRTSKSKVSTRGKRELILALRLVRAKRYLDASKALYKLSKDSRYRNERQQIKYILGLMLSELKLYQTAAYQYVGVVQSGNSKYIDRALEKLTDAADYLNDSRLLNYSMTKINLNKFPKEKWDMLRFRIGEVYLQKEDREKAVQYFAKIPQGSPFYSQAKYQEALAYAQLKRNKQALDAFYDLYKSRSSYGISDKVRVSALMGMARVYYQSKDWEKSIEFYRKIPRETDLWHESLFEMSWAQMRSGKFRSVLSNFHTLHSDYYEISFLPESLLLRGIVYLYICKFDEMEKTLDLFRNIYVAKSNEVKRYFRSKPNLNKIYKDFSEFEYVYEDYSKEVKSNEFKLPAMFYKYVYNQGDVRAVASYLYKLRNEMALINSLDSSWRRSDIGKMSHKLLSRRIQATEKRVGGLVKAHLIAAIDEVDRIAEQEEFARFEMTNSEKESIRSQMIQGEEKQTIDNNADRDFYIDNGYEFWPFRGEYWLDELGNYHYLGVSSCK